ncbi:MAG: Uma2 family endonuclease [Armatimonadaceae bacterium]
MIAVQLPLVTPQQYLEREHSADTKSEYISGEILAMAGGTYAHNAICADVLRTLGNLLDAAGTGCEVLGSDQRVRVTDAGPFFYPDIVVLCSEPRIDEENCLRNPAIVIEVLSESTEEFDRGEKFRHYRRLESLQHYLLIDQNRMRVEHYRCVEGFLWNLLGEYTQAEDRVFFAELGTGVELRVGDIYRRVTLD